MTNPDLARLTPEEAISLKRCETHKQMADKAAGLFSKDDRESKREWKRLDDAMGLLEYLAATTDLPAAVETISALRAEIARLRERLGKAIVYQVPLECDTFAIVRHERDGGWFIWNEYMNRHMDREGQWWSCDSYVMYWEKCKFPDAAAAFAALREWREKGGEG